MATQSCWEKEQQPQQGEVPPEPKSKVAPAPGQARGTGNPGASVPAASSDPCPPGGGAPRGGAAGSSSCATASAGAISVTAEDPWLPSMDCVQERGPSDLQGGQSPHAGPSCVVPEAGQGIQSVRTGSTAAMGQATRVAGRASRPPTHTTSPGDGRGRKQPSREEAAQAQKPPERCLFPGAPGPRWSEPLPQSSPESQPSSSGRSRASPRSHASPLGPALRSRTTAPGPALRS
ncbi:PREDICTED: uncharacterized protein CXorf67-like, partial [Ceratotherium simum simum]|uniref:Uncharacterized protein CXorf67-like n=1 Tax=Ceratotherium simum simum TaxID=73337 RepID=A0ABM1C718_CERSS